METLDNGLQMFDSRAECQTWIDSRLFRFSYSIGKATMPGFEVSAATVPDMWTHSIQRSTGTVIDPTQSDYVRNDMDEPVSKYAKPVRHHGKWFAFLGKKRK